MTGIEMVSDYNLNYQDMSIQAFLFCDQETFNLTEYNLDKRFHMCEHFKISNEHFSHKFSFNNDIYLFYMIKMRELIFLVI